LNDVEINGFVYGKNYRKAPYLMGTSIWFPVDFPLNQSIDESLVCKKNMWRSAVLN